MTPVLVLSHTEVEVLNVVVGSIETEECVWEAESSEPSSVALTAYNRVTVSINFGFDSLETATDARVSTALVVTLSSSLEEVVLLVEVVEVGFDLWFVGIVSVFYL